MCVYGGGGVVSGGGGGGGDGGWGGGGLAVCCRIGNLNDKFYTFHIHYFIAADMRTCITK